MTTQELHIALDILLQKISSNWNKNVLPQEKDFFINREILKFVKQRFNPLSNKKRLSVFDVIKRVEDLNAIIKTVPLTIVTLNSKEVGYQLPFDFLYYISSEINIKPTCEITSIPLVNKTYYYKELTPLKTITGLVSTVLRVFYKGTYYTLFDLSTLPSVYIPQDNIVDYKKAFIYNNAILLEAQKNLPAGIELRFNNKTQTFEFKSDYIFFLDFQVNGSNILTKDYIKQELVRVGVTDLVAEVRIVDEEFKTPINNSYLSSSKDESLVGYLRDNQVIIPILKNAVLFKANLTYICKPSKVDILLGYNSNLPNEVLDEIISNVAESLKAVISSDTYEKFAQDNLLIE